MAGQVKVEVRVDSWSTKRGDVVSVDKDVAEPLIRNGYAAGASPAAKALEDDPGSE